MTEEKQTRLTELLTAAWTLCGEMLEDKDTQYKLSINIARQRIEGALMVMGR